MKQRLAQLSRDWLAKVPWKRWVGRVNALPQRDRMALLAGGLALVVGFVFQVTMPVHDRRVALLLTQPGIDPLQQQTDAMALQQKQAELMRLQQVLAKRTPAQAVSTQGGSPREVFAALRKAMALQEVEVVSLKALPDDAPIKPPVAAAAASTAEVVDVPAEAASDAGQVVPPPAPVPEAKVYRHRAELRVAGSLAQVNLVLKQFESSGQLMQLEKVKLVPAEGDARQVEATLSLVLISQEATWLAM
ncbi:hypothetical protein [Aquabacterium sp.]|uniref:hypothetical protein n=1 Tax=Aquabacterium sp. TaxID=1872578 RepID=UPI002E343CA5|nr:hypothetical protein [Aquabacterium sp.]HEX5311623.1 hypothetical protein [Aquabacterium sp.]